MHHAHQPAALRLVIRRAPCRCVHRPCVCPPGALVLSTPLTPGWSFVATCPAEVVRGIEQAWNEATIAAYARLRGVMYDLAETEETVPAAAYTTTRPHPAEAPDDTDRTRRRRRTKHPATHDPECWVELSDGGWLSPRGRHYGPETRVASAVRSARGMT
jgi:hypothetical protein